MASALRASLASVPSLNVFVSSLLAPRALVKKPFCTPTIAVAWVTFGKYPSLTFTDFAPLLLALEPEPLLPQAARSRVMATVVATAIRTGDVLGTSTPCWLCRPTLSTIGRSANPRLGLPWSQSCTVEVPDGRESATVPVEDAC